MAYLPLSHLLVCESCAAALTSHTADQYSSSQSLFRVMYSMRSLKIQSIHTPQQIALVWFVVDSSPIRSFVRRALTCMILS